MTNNQTILALDPGLRDLGWAVLSGRKLLDSGVETFRFVPRSRRHAAVLAAVRTWFDRHDPDVLVLEATSGDREPPFPAMRRLERALKGQAARRGIPSVVYPAQAVRRSLLGNGWAGKDEVAIALAARFPTVRIYLRQNRRWKERFFQNRTDALALAVHHQAHGA